MDDEGQTCENIFKFREETSKEERKEDAVEKRIMCKIKECNGYKLLIEDCLEVHKNLYHRDQPFDRGHRSTEHDVEKKESN